MGCGNLRPANQGYTVYYYLNYPLATLSVNPYVAISCNQSSVDGPRQRSDRGPYIVSICAKMGFRTAIGRPQTPSRAYLRRTSSARTGAVSIDGFSAPVYQSPGPSEGGAGSARPAAPFTRDHPASLGTVNRSGGGPQSLRDRGRESFRRSS